MERSGIVFAANNPDHSLLVMTLPEDMTEEGVEIQSFAVPLISRKKGLMLALPVGLIKSGLLSPGGPIDEDAVVGPSHIFEVDLILEDEFTGAPYSADTKVEVLVADFSNDVLPLLRDYDPVSDSTEGIRGYDERHPTGIPTAPDLLTMVMTWAESDMASRAHFYSAREEPGPKTSGVAKRPPAKRMTTAALAEQITTLSAQVSLLTAQQRQGLELEEKPMVVKSPPPRTPAIRAPEPNVLVAQGMVPKMPAVSAGLQSPEIHRSASRVLQLAGPPPKTRAFLRDFWTGSTPIRRALRSSQGTSGDTRADSGISSCGSQCIGVTSHSRRRFSQHGFSRWRCSFEFHKRHREKREATAGACLQTVRVLSGPPAADLPEAQPISSSPQVRGGGPKEVPFVVDLFGALWGIQGPEGSGPYDVDAGARFGCSGFRRLLCYQRVLGPFGDGARAKCIRCGRLGARIRAIPFGGPSTGPLPGEDELHHRCRETLFAPDTSSFRLGNLAYLKEIDVLQSRRQETRTRKTGQSSGKGEEESPSPKRRPKFPKKPKGAGEGQQ